MMTKSFKNIRLSQLLLYGALGKVNISDFVDTQIRRNVDKTFVTGITKPIFMEIRFGLLRHLDKET